MTRFEELITKTPLATLCAASTCCLIYGYQLIDDTELTQYTICPRNVIYLHEYYRLLTSGVFHGNLMHLGMNVMSTLAVGGMLERHYGTLQQTVTILWGLLLVPIIEISAAVLLYHIFGYEHLMYQHSVGFSGVLFQLSVLEANLHPHSQRSVFGFITVSSKLYPWMLLVVLQFIMPHVSFWGHLSGILVGTLQHHGCFSKWLFPSKQMLRQLQDHPSLQSTITQRSNYIPVPVSENDNNDNEEVSSCSVRQIRNSLLGIVYTIYNAIRNIVQLFHYIIFGGNVTSSQQQQQQPSLVDDSLYDNNDDTTRMTPQQRQPGEDEEDIELQAALIRSMEEYDNSNNNTTR